MYRLISVFTLRSLTPPVREMKPCVRGPLRLPSLPWCTYRYPSQRSVLPPRSRFRNSIFVTPPATPTLSLYLSLSSSFTSVVPSSILGPRTFIQVRNKVETLTDDPRLQFLRLRHKFESPCLRRPRPQSMNDKDRISSLINLNGLNGHVQHVG